jgi:hypothetical protein
MVAAVLGRALDPFRRAIDSIWAARFRTLLLAAVLFLAAARFIRVVDVHYPIGQWLFWHYARAIALSAAWALTCVCAGHRALTLLRPATAPILEHFTLSFAVGVLLFFLAMFVGGIAGLYGPVFAIALPSLMCAASAGAVIPYVARVVRHLRFARRKPHASTPLWLFPIAAYGVIGIGMLYFLILAPENVAYDTRWYHLAIAEHYAAAGAVRASPEGWFCITIPHLASFLYAWAFEVPGLAYFDRIELAAHMEFATFLATLAGIPVLVRAVVPRVRAPLAWTATFLFPGIFLYDSSLLVAADHIAALWAVPIYLTMRRALSSLEPRRCAVFAAMLAGAVLTKYQTIALVAGPLIAFSLRTVWLGAKAVAGRAKGPERIWAGPAVGVITGLALTAPHWLKNWLFYGDPLYPFLYRHFHDHPWTADATQRIESIWLSQMAPLEGTFVEKVRKALVDGVLNFSFIHHDWPAFHGQNPVFGSLFTLLFATLPFLRKSGRTALLFLCGNVGVFVWYWSLREDRYLQAQLPWMAASVAAALVLIWRSGVVGRLACVPLVGAQIIWGGDVYFYPTDPMLRESPIKSTVDLMSAYFRGDSRRLSPYGGWFDIGSALPKGSKVLVHHSHVHLGLQAMSVSDWEGWQGGISYGQLGSPRAIYSQLADWGVTHLVWGGDVASDSLAGDLAFWRFAKLFAAEPTVFRDGLTLVKMPAVAPPNDASPDTVLIRACGEAKPYADGVYMLSDLTLGANVSDPASAPAPRLRLEGARDPRREAALESVQLLVLERACDPAIASLTPASFKAIGARGPLELWARRPH